MYNCSCLNLPCRNWPFLGVVFHKLVPVMPFARGKVRPNLDPPKCSARRAESEHALKITFRFFFSFWRHGHPPRGGVMNCAQVKSLGIPFRSQRPLSAHPSPLGISVLSSSWSLKVNFCFPPKTADSRAGANADLRCTSAALLPCRWSACGAGAALEAYARRWTRFDRATGAGLQWVRCS